MFWDLLPGAKQYEHWSHSFEPCKYLGIDPLHPHVLRVHVFTTCVHAHIAVCVHENMVGLHETQDIICIPYFHLRGHVWVFPIRLRVATVTGLCSEWY